MLLIVFSPPSTITELWFIFPCRLASFGIDFQGCQPERSSPQPRVEVKELWSVSPIRTITKRKEERRKEWGGKKVLGICESTKALEALMVPHSCSTWKQTPPSSPQGSSQRKMFWSKQGKSWGSHGNLPSSLLSVSFITPLLFFGAFLNVLHSPSKINLLIQRQKHSCTQAESIWEQSAVRQRDVVHQQNERKAEGGDLLITHALYGDSC